jgi:two-component system LytT family response regulator
MTALRVLLVDDEPLVREGIREYLADEPDVVVAGECADGLEALAFLEGAERPVDVAFLDIRMPRLDGLELARALVPDGPAVVFVTAFSEHAIRAFELNAVDYLLKPFDRERLRAALDRARARRGGSGQADLASRLERVLADLQRERGWAERLLVRQEGRIRLVPVEAVDWIEAADNYVRIHAGGERHLLRETIRSLEERLDPARFARIHRSAIVNLSCIRELQPTFNGEYAVLLKTGAKLTLSRSYRDVVRARLGGEW